MLVIYIFEKGVSRNVKNAYYMWESFQMNHETYVNMAAINNMKTKSILIIQCWQSILKNV